MAAIRPPTNNPSKTPRAKYPNTLRGYNQQNSQVNMTDSVGGKQDPVNIVGPGPFHCFQVISCSGSVADFAQVPSLLSRVLQGDD